MKCPACNNEVKGKGIPVKTPSATVTVCSPQCAKKIGSSNKPNATPTSNQTPTPVGRP